MNVGLDQYVGSVLAQRYRIDRPIGVGGMGAVFEAFQLDLGRRVALKLLLGAPDPGDLARFKTEALAVAAASHVNVVQLFELGIEHDPPFLAMELLEGQTLRARMSEGPLPAKAAIDIAVQILSALQTAHAAGVIHRDLKPSNIFLSSNVLGIDLVKVLDFGIAKFAGTAPQTAMGAVVGTPAYMAPEQILGEKVDARSDIHAVGILLHEMISGQRAFGPGVDVAVRVVRDTPPRLDALRPGIPVVVADVVARALSKDPSARFDDARAMLAALDACRAATPAGAPPPTETAPATIAVAVTVTEREPPQTLLEHATARDPLTQASPQATPLEPPAAHPPTQQSPQPQRQAHPPAPAAQPVQPQAQQPRTQLQGSSQPPRAAPLVQQSTARTSASGSRRITFVVVALALLLVGLAGGVAALLWSYGSSKLDAERAQLDKLVLPPCPPPTSCTGSATVWGEPRSYCIAPASATIPPYVNGESVIIRDGKVAIFVHLTSVKKNGTMTVQRLSGASFDVSSPAVLGRACRR